MPHGLQKKRVPLQQGLRIASDGNLPVPPLLHTDGKSCICINVAPMYAMEVHTVLSEHSQHKYYVVARASRVPATTMTESWRNAQSMELSTSLW